MEERLNAEILYEDDLVKVYKGGLFLRNHAGEGEFDDGTKFKISTTMNFAPIIEYGDFTAIFDWNKLVSYVEQLKEKELSSDKLNSGE